MAPNNVNNKGGSTATKIVGKNKNNNNSNNNNYCILVSKHGTLKEIRATELEYCKVCKTPPTYESEFKRQVTWTIKKYATVIDLWARANGRAGQENHYEFPPPVDEVLFFGECLIVSRSCDSVSGSHTPLTVASWKKMYAHLFGGFNDLLKMAGADENELDELACVSDKKKTRDGYLKDGFIVDDGAAARITMNIKNELHKMKLVSKKKEGIADADSDYIDDDTSDGDDDDDDDDGGGLIAGTTAIDTRIIAENDDDDDEDEDDEDDDGDDDGNDDEANANDDDDEDDDDDDDDADGHEDAGGEDDDDDDKKCDNMGCNQNKNKIKPSPKDSTTITTTTTTTTKLTRGSSKLLVAQSEAGSKSVHNNNKAATQPKINPQLKLKLKPKPKPKPKRTTKAALTIAATATVDANSGSDAASELSEEPYDHDAFSEKTL